MSSMKNLMESIDDIYEADEDSFEQESELSAPELLKEIVGSLRDLSTKVADGSIEDLASLTSDLQTISDSLKELTGSDEGSEDEYSDEFESDDGEDELEEDYGAEGMGPSFDANGTQNYENPQGSSYPEKKGFVGI